MGTTKILTISLLIAFPSMALLHAQNHSPITINEIFPNPGKGKSGKEWIELANTGPLDIELGGWSLDDAEGGSKPWTIPPGITIRAHGHLLIPKEISKLVLNNDHDEVRLFDPKRTLVQSVRYQGSRPDSSYVPATETAWTWENNPTPNRPNPEYEELQGIIQTPFTENSLTFLLSLPGQSIQKIHFEPSVIPPTLARVTFTRGAQIKIVVKKVSDRLYLQNYEVLFNNISKEREKGSRENFILVCGILIALAGIIFLSKKTWRKVE